jgi:Glycosyltransferase family 87
VDSAIEHGKWSDAGSRAASPRQGGKATSSPTSYAKAMYLVAALLFIGWCLLILGPPGLPARGLDFRIFYTAASLDLAQLYQLDNQAAFQDALWSQYGRYVTSPFPRPPFYVLLLKPLAWLSYSTALHLWLAALIASLCGVALLMQRLYGVSAGVFALFVGYYPISVSLRNGQDSAFLLLALLGAIAFLREDRLWPAALCLGFCFQKFNMVYLLPVVLVLHGRFDLLKRLAVVVSALGAISVAAIGPSGVQSYLGLLTGGSLDSMFWDAWNIRAAVWHFGWRPEVYAACTVIALAWSVFLLRRTDFETAIWLSVACSLIVSWHCYSYDYAVALPFFYIAWKQRRVWLAGLVIAGGLWPHFFLMEKLSWAVTIVIVMATVEFWIRRRPLEALKEPQSVPA